MLADAVSRATATHREAEAARGYRMLGTCASVLVEYDRAERWITDGIGYAEQVELWNHRHYMAAHLAHVQWCTGNFAGCGPDRPAGPRRRPGRHHHPDHRAVVLGYLALGRG